MKKILFLTIMISLAGSWQPAAQATKFINTQSPGFEADSIYEDDVFLSAFNAKFESKVVGDLFAFCYTIVQSDSVVGNFMAFAYKITNFGPVTGSYRGFGREVSCNSDIGRNLLLFGQAIDVGTQAHIKRNADLKGENVLFVGIVDGTLSINARQAVISGSIGGDLNFDGDSLIINPNTTIAGNINYTSPNRINIGQGAVINGQVEWKKETKEKPEQEEKSVWHSLTRLLSLRGYAIYTIVLWILIFIASIIPIPGLLVSIILWFVLLVSGNILIAIYKSRAMASEAVLNDKFFPSMGLGFMIFIIAPIVTFVLFMTVLASPLALMLFMVFGMAIFAGGIYSGLFIGRKICRMMGSSGANTPGFLCFTIGTTLMMIVSLIPVLGYLVVFLLLLAGLGAVVQSFRKNTTSENQVISQ